MTPHHTSDGIRSPKFRLPRSLRSALSTRSRRLTAAGTALAAAACTLLLGFSDTALAKPAPSVSPIPLGGGYMGVGYRMDNGLSPSATPGPSDGTGGVQGIDVSHYQGAVDWAAVKAAGVSFAWIKATEGTSVTDAQFSANYSGAYNAKVIRGAYHFARPDESDGATQAAFFAAHGGGWSADNLTLPGALDIEGTCYGLSAAAMQQWLTDFYNTYKAKTGRDVVVYTSPSWWSSCTGGWNGLAAKTPLWDAHWTTAASPTLPAGFSAWTVWQYSDSGTVGGISGAVDRDKFNGTADRLLALANNT